MATKEPSFLLYPSKALESEHLKPVAFKAYWLVLWWMWLNAPDQCSIPNDQSLIMRVGKLTAKGYATAWMGEVMCPGAEMLRTEGERLVSNGLRKQAVDQTAKSTKAAASADARWKSSERMKVGDPLFNQFWAAYPRKTGKATAEEKWSRIDMSEELLQKILKALSWQSKQDDWIKEKRKFCPHPATYLYQKRWEDEEPSDAGEDRPKWKPSEKELGF